MTRSSINLKATLCVTVLASLGITHAAAQNYNVNSAQQATRGPAALQGQQDTGFANLEDGRRVIYGADGTIYIEDSLGAGTYSASSVLPTTETIQQAPVAQQQPRYDYSVTTYGQPASAPATPSYQPNSGYADPAVAPYSDPYQSQYGSPSAARTLTQQPQNNTYSGSAPQYQPQYQPQQQTVVRDYLDWPKQDPTIRQPKEAKEIRRLMEDASFTISDFLEDSNYGALWRSAKNAKAIIVVPRMVRGGFIVGGSGGNAIAMARKEDGSWSNPAFYTIGSASIGLQIGADVSETILLVMTNRGMEQLLSSSAKLGGDIAVAAGPYGAGAKAQTTDVIAFSQSKGLYGGISLEGAVLKARYSWNKLYYGGKVSTADILIRDAVVNPNSTPVQTAAARLTNVRLRTAPLDIR